MLCIHRGKVIPDMVVELSEDKDGNPRLNLVTSFDYANGKFLRWCMSERDLGSATCGMRKFMERTIMVQRTFWDAKARTWLSGRFDPREYMDLVKRSVAKGYVPQYGKPKWPTGGGRAAKAAGKFFYAKEDVMDSLYHSVLGVDPSKMSSRDKVARSPLVLADPIRFGIPPVIKLVDIELGGVVYVSEVYASANNIHDGDKLWPIKASARVLPMYKMEMWAPGIDMVIPKDAVKLKEHWENSGLLAGLMGYLPDLTAEARSSKAKDRMPKLALDVMQWLYPEIGNLMDTDPVIMDRLALVRRVVEGNASLGEVLALGEYKDPKTGEPNHPMEFQFLKRGQPLEQSDIRDAVFRSAGTAITKALCFKVAGAYGVAMPNLESANRKRLAFCPPWMLPFWVESDISSHVIGTDSSWMVGCLGKDYDGDLLMVMELGRLLKRIDLSPEIFPDWTKQGQPGADGKPTFPDREWAAKWLTLPTKGKGDDPRNVHEVMVDGLKGYGLIGRATNMCMVVLDALRAQGKTDRRTLMGIYLKMMSTEVQQFVDSIKYTPGGLWAPRLEDFKTRNGRVIPGMATRYGVEVDLALRVREYFRAVRSMDFDALASLPEDKELSGSFYYRIASLFRGWKPVSRVNMSVLGQWVAEKYGVTDRCKMDRMRRQSFVKYKGDVKSRIQFLTPVLGTTELMIGLAGRAWANKDVVFAMSLERMAGKRIVDHLAEYQANLEAKRIQASEVDEVCDEAMQNCD